MAAVRRGPLARLQGVFIKAAYRIYLWSFRGTQEVFEVSERIVEYPFAVKALRHLPRGSPVIVIGCHGDLLSTILACLDLDVVGVDVKEFPLRYENFTFHKADIRHTDFGDASFDAAVAVSTVEHIGLFDADPDGDRTAAREILRILKPGGLLVLTVPFGSEYLEIPMRQRIYDSDRLRRLLEGFDLLALTPYAYTPVHLWTSVAPADVPEPSRYTTHCTALVTASKPPSPEAG